MSSHTQNHLTTVLVHEAWADGSSWNKVTTELQRRGFRVVTAQLPLTSLADDVTTLRRVLRSQDPPVVLVVTPMAVRSLPLRPPAIPR